jgi:hypothetical protein
MDGVKNSEMRRLIGAITLTIGIASMLLGCVFLLPVLHHNNQPDTCSHRLFEGQTPLRDTEPDPVVSSQVTFLPVGVICTMVRANGAKSEGRYIDWAESSMIYGGATVAVFGYVLLVRPPRRGPKI